MWTERNRKRRIDMEALRQHWTDMQTERKRQSRIDMEALKQHRTETGQNELPSFNIGQKDTKRENKILSTFPFQIKTSSLRKGRYLQSAPP